MTVTLLDILNASPTLQKITNHQFSGRKALMLAKLMKRLQSELDLYEEEKSNLFKKYCVLKEDGSFETDSNNYIRVKNGEEEEFELVMKELVETKIEIEDAMKVPLSWLEDVSLSSNDAGLITIFIDEEK